MERKLDKTYIGIDPGSKGYITAILPDGQIDTLAISGTPMEHIADYLAQFPPSTSSVCMEEVHAIFGSSAKATFAFGKIDGILLGIIISMHLPYTLVPPKTWQKEIWCASDKVCKSGNKVDTKATSIRAAQRLYPGRSFTRTERCSKIDDNLVDSLLIATYAKRKNL